MTNSLSELKNKTIVKFLRAHCDNKADFHQYLPCIAAASNSFYNTALGASPYFFVFGREYVWPIDTILTTNQQSFLKTSHSTGLEAVAERFRILRNIMLANIRDARANTERVKNADAVPISFELGDRVFVSQEFGTGQLTNRKHSVQFLGPMVVVDRFRYLYKLQFMYSGKLLRNWVHACKIRRLRDESRQNLYNRLNSQPPDTTAPQPAEQRTVQAPISTHTGHTALINDQLTEDKQYNADRTFSTLHDAQHSHSHNTKSLLCLPITKTNDTHVVENNLRNHLSFPIHSEKTKYSSEIEPHYSNYSASTLLERSMPHRTTDFIIDEGETSTTMSRITKDPNDCKSSTQTIPSVKQSFIPMNWRPKEAFYDNRVIRISAKKRGKFQPLFKALYGRKIPSRWVTIAEIAEIPPHVLCQFYVQLYRKNNKHKNPPVEN